MANTLLSYFRDGVKRNGGTAKYLDRYFLGVFITEYNESHRTGSANYEKTKTTDFYKKNSCDYCLFLELYYSYRVAMDRLNGTAAAD